MPEALDQLPAGVRTVRAAGRVALADARAIHGGGRWLCGWLTRCLCQVAYFASLGWLVGDAATGRYVAVGACVMLAVMDAMLAVGATAWDVGLRTLESQVHAPQAMFWTALGRGWVWPASGVLTSLVALAALAPALGVRWQHAWVVPVAALAAAAGTYPVALTLGALTLFAHRARSVVANLGYLATTVLTGAFTPVADLPAVLRPVSDLLPSAHALQAVRAAAGQAPGTSPGHALLWSLATGLLWLAIAAAAFPIVERTVRARGIPDTGD